MYFIENGTGLHSMVSSMASSCNMLNILPRSEPSAEIYIWAAVFGIALYIWAAICLQKIAEKTNTPNGWLAWIPIANIYLMCMIAGKAWWWLLLCLIPYVNIIFIIILWWKIAEVRGKPGWWGLLFIVPIVNFVILGMLAFSD